MLPFDPSELARYGGLARVARTVVEGFLAGIHRTPFKVPTLDTPPRPHSPGDGLRGVDWRAYSRTDRVLVKGTEAAATRTALLVVDASGSMRYRGKQALSKFEYARQVSAALAYLVLAGRDAAGLAVHDTHVRRFIAPRAGLKHLLELIHALEAVRHGGETALAPVWHALATTRLKRPGLVVLLSDCFDDPAHLCCSLQRLRRRGHEVLLFHVLAPEEIDFPFDRPTWFRDLEGGEGVKLDARRVRAEYRANFEAYHTELRRRARELRVDYHLLRTDEPVDRALWAYLACGPRG